MNQLMNIENLSTEELRVLQDKIVAQQVTRLQQQLEAVTNRLAEHEQKFELVEQRQDKVVEVAVNGLRVKQGHFEYVSQGDFGRYFSVSIGSQFIGKLLKVVGLAQKGKKLTTPYREHIPRYAKTNAATNYTANVWHYQNCMEYIDKWLKENGLYEHFYSIQDEREMAKFINDLFESRVSA
jgi:hypothetical protein